MRRTIGLAIAVLVLAGARLEAQTAATGNVYGKVTDPSGAALPGAAITLSSAFGNRSTLKPSEPANSSTALSFTPSSRSTLTLSSAGEG